MMTAKIYPVPNPVEIVMENTWRHLDLDFSKIGTPALAYHTKLMWKPIHTEESEVYKSMEMKIER
jgi:hypothetical protein